MPDDPNIVELFRSALIIETHEPTTERVYSSCRSSCLVFAERHRRASEDRRARYRVNGKATVVPHPLASTRANVC